MADHPPETSGTLLRSLLRRFLQFADQPLAAAFILLTISVVGITFAGMLLVSLADIAVIEVQRLASSLTTLAAITLVGFLTVSFFLKVNAKPWVLALGLLSIGALIVPTNDLIRIVLVAVGTETDIQRLFPAHDATSHGRKEAVQDRARALHFVLARARQDPACETAVVTLLEDFLTKLNQLTAHALYAAILGVQTQEECESVTLQTITRFLTDEEEKEMLHVVEDRGLLDLLAAVGDDDARTTLVFDHVGSERFRADLHFLRAEGLISFLYDNMSTIQLTAVGRRVASRAGIAPTATGAMPAASSAGPNTLDLTSGFYTGTHFFGSDGGILSFQVPEAGMYTLDVIGRQGGDPTIQLLRAGSNSAQPELLAEDDDGGNDFNSRLLRYLDSGRYLLHVSDYWDVAVEVDVTIRREGQP